MHRSNGGRSRVRKQAKIAAWGASLVLPVALAASLRAQEQPVAPVQPSADSHPVVEGDTLWGVSGRYLGSSYEWPRLWSYNPEITNPHWIYPGHVLRLHEGAVGGYTAAPGAPGGAPGAAQSARLLRKGGNMASRGKVLIGEQVYLDKDALKESARIVGSPDDHMMFSPSDDVYLKLAKGESVAEGKELMVFRRIHRAELAPRSSKIKQYHAGDGGEIVRVIGALRVQSVDDEKHIARAVVLEATDPIERGFEVTDVPRVMLEVAPRPSSRKVEAQILAATQPLGQLGENQIVFINAGSKVGVEVGNRFVVVRQGDPWRQNLSNREELVGQERPDLNPLPTKAFPWEVVGEVRTLYVRPESSTGLITEALVELTPGDRVELREGY